ncbi:HdeD family acid-resistance protein [Pseudobdellovibrio exovorus]|uniref:HdeD protein n=1 Tax=Pseudobdellovibrio exovorus JSS TaxID=1184267 RepID=M4VB43_9BACT|nr:HdeD family acid-resistance protein [Pseudobdellovibrio exovorus]AGH95695.1 hypothetical protein A11Q_1479 [Pseudobdellovibrio exovorus JSS]
MASESTTEVTTVKSDGLFNAVSVPLGSGRWLMALGIALMVLGIFALVASVATTLMSIVFIGAMLLVASIFQVVFAITAGRWVGVGVHLLLFVLYGVTGAFLIFNPIVGAATLTLFLAFFFIVSGLFRAAYAATLRYSEWGWSFLGGMITTALGAYVLMNMPETSLVLLGVLFGIDLLLVGMSFFWSGFGIRKVTSVHKSSKKMKPMRAAHT